MLCIYLPVWLTPKIAGTALEISASEERRTNPLKDHLDAEMQAKPETAFMNGGGGLVPPQLLSFSVTHAVPALSIVRLIHWREKQTLGQLDRPRALVHCRMLLLLGPIRAQTLRQQSKAYSDSWVAQDHCSLLTSLFWHDRPGPIFPLHHSPSVPRKSHS